MENNSSNIGTYILRCLGTVILSCIGAIVIFWLSHYVIIAAYNLFAASGGQIMKDIAKESVIPGWGSWDATFNGPNLSSRISTIIVIIIVAVVFCIFAGIMFLTGKIIKGSKVMTVLSGLFFVAEFGYSIYLIFFTSMADAIGIHNERLFYFVSVIALIFHAFIIGGMLSMFWINEEFD